MLYRFFSFSFFLLIVGHVYSQNLVPNPSFEEFENGCPINFNEMPIGWNKWRSSPNSFSTCVIPGNLIDSLGWAPWNGFGFQEPAEGESYVGLYAFSPSPKPEFDPDYREYIGCELVEPLEVGMTYYVSFKTSLGFTGSYYDVIWACNKIGVLFTTQDYGEEGNELEIPNFAHIYSEEIISDTLNWVVISGSFIADQAYSHMGLGVFFEFNQLDTINLLPGISNLGSYYYLDQVCVSESPICEVSSEVFGTAFCGLPILIGPNPAENFVQIRNVDCAMAISMISFEGETVYQTQLLPGHETLIDVSLLKSGSYLLQATSSESIQREKLVIVH